MAYNDRFRCARQQILNAALLILRLSGIKNVYRSDYDGLGWLAVA